MVEGKQKKNLDAAVVAEGPPGVEVDAEVLQKTKLSNLRFEIHLQI